MPRAMIMIRPDNTAAAFTVDIPCSDICMLIGFLVFMLPAAYIIAQ